MEQAQTPTRFCGKSKTQMWFPLSCPQEAGSPGGKEPTQISSRKSSTALPAICWRGWLRVGQHCLLKARVCLARLAQLRRDQGPER